MRTRIRVDDKWYRPVPWMKEGECYGCAFDRRGCINTEARGSPCDDGNEFTEHVLIPVGTAAYEEYITKAVLRRFDNAETD